jgi:UDP-glucose 4-epimerase
MMKLGRTKRVPDIPSNVAVTGACGFFGQNLIKRLIGLDGIERIVATDVREPTLPDDEKIVFQQLDVREPHDDLYSSHGVEAIFHLAYIVRPPRNPSEARTVNVDATATLLSTCTELGIRRFIYPSSTTVYGARASNDHFFAETETPTPLPGFHYSVDKVAAEKLILAWDNETPDATAIIYRGCPVMGVNAENFILNTLKMKFIPMPAFKNPPMQFLHIDDQISAFGIALTAQNSGIYNLAGADSIDWRTMASLFGNNSLPIPAPLLKTMMALTWATRIQSKSPGSGINFISYPWSADITLAGKELGWRPKYSSKQALMAAK